MRIIKNNNYSYNLFPKKGRGKSYLKQDAILVGDSPFTGPRNGYSYVKDNSFFEPFLQSDDGNSLLRISKGNWLPNIYNRGEYIDNNCSFYDKDSQPIIDGLDDVSNNISTGAKYLSFKITSILNSLNKSTADLIYSARDENLRIVGKKLHHENLGSPMESLIIKLEDGGKLYVLDCENNVLKECTSSSSPNNVLLTFPHRHRRGLLDHILKPNEKLVIDAKATNKTNEQEIIQAENATGSYIIDGEGKLKYIESTEDVDGE